MLKQKALTILAAPKMPLGAAEESRAAFFAASMSSVSVPAAFVYCLCKYLHYMPQFSALLCFSQIPRSSRELVEVFVSVCVPSEQCHGLFPGVINCAHSHVRYLSLTPVPFLLDVSQINQA